MTAAAIAGHIRARLQSDAGRRLIWSFMAAVAARLGLLALSVVLARRFGPEGYGTFTFATGTALLVAQLAVLGWPMLMNRLIPGMIKNREWGLLKGLRDAADGVTLLSGLASAIILAGIGYFVPSLSTGFYLAALLVPPTIFALLRRQQLAAVRLPAVGLLFDQGFGALLAVAVLLAIGGAGIAESVMLFAASMLVGITITTIIFRRRLPSELASAERRTEIRRWMMIAIPLLVGMSSRLLMNKTDVVMLAPLSNLHETGLYGAAFRVTYLLTFPQVVLMSVVTPLISEAFAHERIGQVRRLVKIALMFACATSIPFALAIILVPELIMSTLFGADFAEAGFILVLLTLGQLAVSFSIPFQSLLAMGGRERVFGGLNLAGLAVHVALNFALVPSYGAKGAAVSTLIVAVFLLVAQIALNYRLLRPRHGAG